MASPTSSLNEMTSGSSSPLGFFLERLTMESPTEISPTCSQCKKTYNIPKVLPCFHTFCTPCLEKLCESHPDKVITCPTCKQETFLMSSDINSLPSDYALINFLEKMAMKGNLNIVCTGCKTDTVAAARCYDCNNFICGNCLMAHEYMLCFEKHQLTKFNEVQNHNSLSDCPVICTAHKSHFQLFCIPCGVPICKDCTVLDHPKGVNHEVTYLHEVSTRQLEQLMDNINEAKIKNSDLYHASRSVEQVSTKVKNNYEKAKNDIHETFTFYQSSLEERKAEILKELEHVYNSKHTALNTFNQKLQDATSKMQVVSSFVEKLLKFSNATEILVFKQLLETRFQSIFNFNPEMSSQHSDLEFLSNYQAIQVGVRNTFGYVRHNSDLSSSNKPQPISRPNGNHSDKALMNGHVFDSSIISKRFSSPNSLGPFTTSVSEASPYPIGVSNGPYSGNMSNGPYSNSGTSPAPYTSSNTNGPFNSSVPDVNTYEKWSSGGNDIFQNGTDTFSMNSEPMMDIGKFSASSLYPLKSQLKRQKMIYHCKFGEFGILEGQFTEPSGVAVNAQNDIIVADTNNHRIQIFDKEGRFKFQFGECGKRDGQLLYPNRVAVVRTSGDIIVTERSPTHQIQIYNQYGQFVRKFGANILQHPRGVTVDNKGRIIVVECKVMRVIIFDQGGAILTKFGCSKHLEFPNGVVVNDKQEIFISDNRAHCVKVFDYEGHFLRQIGGEGLTNYPIGVCISPTGEILVADNHNNFNITIFTQEGDLVSALESKVKHAQCFDVALMDDGSVVLASKDYRLYVYRYMQIPAAMGL